MPILLLLALVFVTVPVLELYLILRIGDLIGAGPTILLLIADSLLGAWLLRRQGRAAWRRFTRTLGEGKMPHREVLDGFFIIAGAILLLTPGFLSDIVGLALLLPPTRAIARAIVMRRLSARLTVFGPAATAQGPTAPGRSGQGRDDVDSTAVDLDDDFFNFQNPKLGQ